MCRLRVVWICSCVCLCNCTLWCVWCTLVRLPSSLCVVQELLSFHLKSPFFCVCIEGIVSSVHSGALLLRLWRVQPYFIISYWGSVFSPLKNSNLSLQCSVCSMYCCHFLRRICSPEKIHSNVVDLAGSPGTMSKVLYGYFGDRNSNPEWIPAQLKFTQKGSFPYVDPVNFSFLLSPFLAGAYSKASLSYFHVVRFLQRECCCSLIIWLCQDGNTIFAIRLCVLVSEVLWFTFWCDKVRFLWCYYDDISVVE